MKSCSVLSFYSKHYTSAIEKLAFQLPNIYFLGENHFAGKLFDTFVSQHNKFYCKCERDYIEIFQWIIEQVHSQLFFDYKSIYMEVVAFEHFNKFKPSTTLLQNFIIIHLITVIRMIALLQHIFTLFFNFFLKINYGSVLDNHVGLHWWFSKASLLCISYVYIIMSCFKISIIVDISVGAPGRGKYLVDGMNNIDKWMIKLEMANLLNPWLVLDDPICFKFIQVYEKKRIPECKFSKIR